MPSHDPSDPNRELVVLIIDACEDLVPPVVEDGAEVQAKIEDLSEEEPDPATDVEKGIHFVIASGARRIHLQAQEADPGREIRDHRLAPLKIEVENVVGLHLSFVNVDRRRAKWAPISWLSP